MKRIVLGAAVLGLLVGCQSRAEGLRALCDAPRDCPECMSAPPELQAVLLSTYIDDHLSNGEVRDLFQPLPQVDPAQRVVLVRDAAAAEGITECPLLDVWGQ